LDREPFVRLRPVFKDYLWGGEKLKKLFGAAQERVAEAWLLSAHPDGESVIADGQYTGMPFRKYLQTEENNAEFPILVKMIDAAQTLSVQVHPDDAYARVHEHDHGKNELWIVLDSAPDAYLYVGFSRDVAKEEVRRRVEDGTIEAVLHKVPTHAEDFVYIPAGTVHAIGAGNLILEVQQSSNATYRLYDYQRLDANGRLRPLHISKALDVLNGRRYDAAVPPLSPQGERAAECPYFGVSIRTVEGSFTLPMADGRFASVVCVRGEGRLRRDGRETALRPGDSLYLPAGDMPAEINGNLTIAVTRAAQSAAPAK
jgi:mannose-6-phosphate isomerase